MNKNYAQSRDKDINKYKEPFFPIHSGKRTKKPECLPPHRISDYLKFQGQCAVACITNDS